MPPVRTVYLLEAFHLSGRCMYSGFGPMPLSWTEIEAFAAATKAISRSFEKQTIAAMSREYITGLSLGEKPSAIAPWHDPNFQLFARPKQNG